MKTLLLFLLSIVYCNAFAQESKKGGLESIDLMEGRIYHKVCKDIESLPSSFSRSKVRVLSINDFNNKKKFIVIEGTEVIGSSVYTRTGLISIEQAKKLLKFLQFANDSIITRVPVNEEEIVLKLNDDFKAVVFSTSQDDWQISFTLHAYHKYSFFLKRDSTMEIAAIIMRAIR